MRYPWLLLVLCLSASLHAADPVAADRVIIVVIDGPRWTETWGAEGRPYIPVRNALAAEGTLYTDFSNDGRTYTNAGHAALTTGFYQEIDNSGKEFPAKAGIFQRYLAKSSAKAEDAWIVSAKDKLDILADTTDPEWRGKHRPSADCGRGGRGGGSGYRSDADTLSRLMYVLKEHHPRVVLVNLRGPDSEGHANRWDGYLAAIRETDAAIGVIWDFLKKDPAYAGRTVLMVTNDHGRHPDGHEDGFISHGDDCAGCRKIELLAMGPGFPAGSVVASHHGQIDIAATAAGILGVELPGSPGRSLLPVPAPASK